MTFYFENLNFSSLYILLKRILKIKYNIRSMDCYYIDSSKLGQNIAAIAGNIFGLNFNKLSFKMVDIKDENNELVRIRIARKDLFEFEKNILNGDAYNELYENRWNKDELILFLKKGLVSSSISSDPGSTSRMLFIIDVINWHMKKIEIINSELYINQGPWVNEYSEVAIKYGINLHTVKKSKSIFSVIKLHLNKIIKNNLRLLILFRNIQIHVLFKKNKKLYHDRSFLFLEGRGDINFNNDGQHSDFFWVFNSGFSRKDIIYRNFPGEEKHLKTNGVKFLSQKIKYYKIKYFVPKVKRSSKYNEERKEIKKQLLLYKSLREYWSCLFKTYNIKIYSTWYKYDNDHMAKSDAIKDVGGISVVQQIAFDGYKTYECSIYADIAFRYSKWICDNEKELDSKIKYQIITGYPNDYALPLLKKEAIRVRKKLINNGAKKIVFVIDENSGYDERWHTGHGLQRENYSFILNKMFETPWLGIIFKPKYAKTLRKRIGEETWLLLEEAQKTGRCHIYLDSGRMATTAPPLLGGLSADLCIHGHMGNAALECALSNLPTLIIDREGNPNHKFRELKDNEVVFYNWSDTIDAVIEHFENPYENKNFGNWANIVDQFDPFRDGKAAYRIGTFNKWLLDGFKEGKNRDIILENAVDRYANTWGSDKVIAG